MARNEDAAWVDERQVIMDCQVPEDPDDSWSRLNAMGRALDAREAAFRCAVQRMPANADFWTSLGEAQGYRLRLSDAAQSFARGVELDATNQAAFTLVALRSRLGDNDGAISAADALHGAIARSPSRGTMIGMELQAALVRIATRLRAGQREGAAAVWRTESWLIGHGEFCITTQGETILAMDDCKGTINGFPAPGAVQSWGKFATGPLDPLESKCDRGWRVLASAGRHRVVPETYWLPEEEEDAARAAMTGAEGRWLLKLCSGANSMAVHLLPAGAALGEGVRAAAAAAPHVLQRLVEPVWLTPSGHKADMRVHVIVAASSTSQQCKAAVRPAPLHVLGAARIWVSRHGMLRVAPAPHDPSLNDRAALVTSNPLHGRIRDPGASQLWDSLTPEAAAVLRGRIRAVVGEAVRAAGYEPLGDGSSTDTEASLYCNCEMVPQYALYGFDVLFERRDSGLVPWLLEATYAPDMRSDYARSHSAAALFALRAALEAGPEQWPPEAVSAIRRRCAAELGCASETQVDLCARALLDHEREREHLSGLLEPFRPGADEAADDRLTGRVVRVGV